jgi:proteasome lid subunit RPN8/RPN11
MIDPWDLSERVRTRVYDHAYAFPGAEVGGILVGEFPTQARPTTRVDGVLPAFDARGDLTSLTFTHEAWADIHAMKEVQFPNAAIVGWYHTHPGHGIFLSEQDLFIHRNFFPGEATVAYVVDPVRHEEGLFTILDGAMTELFVRPVDSAEAIADRRLHTRRGPTASPEDRAAARARSGPDAPRRVTPREPRAARDEQASRSASGRPSPQPGQAPRKSFGPVEELVRDGAVLLGSFGLALLVTRLVLGA